jgi:hypothetical protein
VSGGSHSLPMIPKSERPMCPPKDDRDFTISGNLKSFEGPVLNCRVSTEHRVHYLNELVILEIRNNTSVIFKFFLFSSVVK